MDAEGVNDMAHAMGDDASFSGAGAGENEEGTVDGGDSLLLLRVETGEEIHEVWEEL